MPVSSPAAPARGARAGDASVTFLARASERLDQIPHLAFAAMEAPVALAVLPAEVSFPRWKRGESSPARGALARRFGRTGKLLVNGPSCLHKGTSAREATAQHEHLETHARAKGCAGCISGTGIKRHFGFLKTGMERRDVAEAQARASDISAGKMPFGSNAVARPNPERGIGGAWSSFWSRRQEMGRLLGPRAVRLSNAGSTFLLVCRQTMVWREPRRRAPCEGRGRDCLAPRSVAEPGMDTPGFSCSSHGSYTKQKPFLGARR